jgi:IMP dehydrogenase
MSTLIEKRLSRAYGLDEIALVPSNITIDPDLVDISVEIAGVKLEMPVIGSAMDSVVSPDSAALMGKFGAAGVLNLEGVQTRYDDPDTVLAKIASVSKNEYVKLMQEIYQKEDIKENLVKERIKYIKDSGAPVIVSSTPQRARWLGPIAAEAGADAFLIQATVVSTKYKSKTQEQNLDLSKFCESMSIPVMLGNATTYSVISDLMRTGVSAIFVGIGPGAACTTRGVLGIGVPMVTSVLEAAKARDDYFESTGKYVSVIADGGIVNSGDICKALACGADAVMIGSPLARAIEAPGKGFHWGMATPNAVLPRGARIEVGTIGSLEEILVGPSNTDAGFKNLAGAIRTSMATIGAENIAAMQKAEVVIAPSLLTEGKVYQKSQGLGMYK